MTLTYSTILFYGIHFYFITLFEVLFYIYYILPYEQSLLLRLFDFPSIGKLANSNYNITVVATELYEMENCRHDTNRIFDANLPLYSYCFYYIGFIHFCLLSLFFYDIYVVIFKKKTDTIMNKNGDENGDENGEQNGEQNDETLVESSLKMTNISSTTTNGLTKNTFSFSSVDTTTNDFSQIKLECKIKEGGNGEQNNKILIKNVIFYWKHSKFVAEFIRSIYFIILIGIFEYIFFTQIVDHFKVFDLKIIICHLLK